MIHRAEIPTVHRIWVVPSETSVQLPLEPLASVVSVQPKNRSYFLWVKIRGRGAEIRRP